MKVLSTALVGSLCVLLIPLACRTSGTSGTKQTENPASLGLDVNDVAILFPPPKEDKELAQLLPITFSNATGASPMTAQLFASFIERHDTKMTIDGKLMSLKSGSSFNAKREDRAFARPENWRIIAMRYDPCAPRPDQNLLKKTQSEIPASFDAGKCIPQLRLTAQPLLEAGFVRDYAIHMLFTLTPEESRAFYFDLVDFKKSCGDVTSSVPLGPHPCLVIEARQGNYGGAHFQKLVEMIKRYALRYTGTAMMATRDGDDPWTFMNALIADGQIQHLPIQSIRENDPSKVKTNEKGIILESFLNGFFQMISFLGVQGDRNDRPRVTPIAKSEQTNLSLDKLFNGVRDHRTVFQTFNAIENPQQNDFFSTDCASCHGANSVFADNSLASPEQVAKDNTVVAGIKGAFNTKDHFDPNKDIHLLRQEAENFFRLESGYTNFVDLNMQSNIFGPRPFAFIHFGYGMDKPLISFRTANEAAMVAKMANTFYGNGARPPLLCDTKRLRQCLQSNRMIRRESFHQLYAPQAICMEQVCPQRAEQLAPLFGEDAPRSYRIKKDLPVGGSVKFKRTAYAVIKQGTVVSGWLRSNILLALVSYDSIPAQSLADGNPIFLYADTDFTWFDEKDPDEYFELIEK